MENQEQNCQEAQCQAVQLQEPEIKTMPRFNLHRMIVHPLIGWSALIGMLMIVFVPAALVAEQEGLVKITPDTTIEVSAWNFPVQHSGP
jgi:hypothetical protein